ncbi:MAG: PQQ-binding-like beta-propeller repeat protein [Verrucomicrobiales bacterium]|nr:PQQ-binding-like beta-propeller repeat protein [Verrucomicrobiales bacterium]
MVPKSPKPALYSILLLATLSATGQEWPRFRGPNGSGHGTVTNFPAEFSPADYDWTIKLNGVGHSSPAVGTDELFLTVYNEEKKARQVLCFHSEEGTRKWAWNHPVEEHNLHKYNNFASSTPAVDSDHVYVVWGSGTDTEAVALTHEGKLAWQRKWSGFISDHGFGASPILVDGVLILHTDNVEKRTSYVMGLNPKTGESLWELERVTTDPAAKHVTAYNTPTSVEVGGKTVLVVLQTNDGWKGVDPKTGEVLWSYQGDYDQRSVGSIASYEDVVFATFGSGGKGKMATALKVKPKGDPEVLYSLGITDGLEYVPTPLFYKGLLYLWGDGGILTCRDAVTGEEVYQQRIGGNFFSSPVVIDDKICCASRDGSFIAVAAGPKFEILGRSQLMSGVNATPAITGNRVIIRTDTHLISIKGNGE